MSQARAPIGQKDSARVFELGDFLMDVGHPGTEKLRLTECPICATDPARPRHRFDEGGVRRRPPAHFRAMHGPDDVGRPLGELGVDGRPIK